MKLPAAPQVADRPVWPSIRHGLRLKCPCCGDGRLFRSYLKVNDFCPHCGEALLHHRADDLPPYLAIIVVGHILVGLMVHLDMTWHIAPLYYLAMMVPLAIVLPLALLPSIKGAVIGLQWAKRLHGFDAAHRDVT